MDFARKILNKYGWKEGEGLGKNSDGIVKPLKASMKFDNAGLGSDQAASDFNNHWWERVFNEAASNVDIKSGKSGVRLNLKNEDDTVEISTKGYSLKKLKKAKQSRSTDDSRYDNFLQSATLTKSGDEIENPHKIAVADISVTQYKTLTDEELFEACGGRTAHKGARHGLKLSGKLSRIEQQEQELLARMQERAYKKSAEKDNTAELQRTKRKKQKKSNSMENVEAAGVSEGFVAPEEYKKQDPERKKKQISNSVSDEVDKVAKRAVEQELEAEQNNSEESVKKRKKKKNKDLLPNVADDEASTEFENLKLKKKKRKAEEVIPYPADVDVVNESDSLHVPRKKRKDDNNGGVHTVTEKISKRSKKSNKKKHKAI